jgi:hypothetical protein
VAEAGSQPQTPDEAELLEALAQLRVGDLLVQSLVTTVSLGYARLDGEGQDLAQARTAIEALRALLPVLEGEVDESLLRGLDDARANLQLAYAKAVEADRSTGGDG